MPPPAPPPVPVPVAPPRPVTVAPPAPPLPPPPAFTPAQPSSASAAAPASAGTRRLLRKIHLKAHRRLAAPLGRRELERARGLDHAHLGIAAPQRGADHLAHDHATALV